MTFCTICSAFCSCILYAVIFIILGILYTCYKRLPSDLDDIRKARILFAIFNLIELLAKVCEYFGFGHRRLSVRALDKDDYVTDTREHEDVKYYDTKFNGVHVRIYEPATDITETRKRPAIVFYHGGGWVVGSVFIYHGNCLDICSKTKCLVVSVNYRLAPEYPFPIPLDDCLNATLHLFENADNFRVDTSRVAVMGDSAGGNLAACVCLKLRDTGSEFRPRLQVLIYPVTQVLDFQLPSYNDPYEIIIGRHAMASYIKFYAGFERVKEEKLMANEHVTMETKRKYRDVIEYLPENLRNGYSMYTTKPDSELAAQFERFVTDPYVAPLMAESLADLPEAYIFVAGYDLLRDEDIMYANKLKDHGVAVTLVQKETAFHGGWSFELPHGAVYRKETCEFITQRL